MTDQNVNKDTQFSAIIKWNLYIQTHEDEIIYSLQKLVSLYLTLKKAVASINKRDSVILKSA